MQSSFGNLEYARSLSQGQKFDRSICIFHEAHRFISPSIFSTLMTPSLARRDERSSKHAMA
jgi:hypothetical protein